MVTDRKPIQAALDEEENLDAPTRTLWQTELEDMARTGWFNPYDEQEMQVALAALRAGQEIPSFSRSG